MGRRSALEATKYDLYTVAATTQSPYPYAKAYDPHDAEPVVEPCLTRATSTRRSHQSIASGSDSSLHSPQAPSSFNEQTRIV